MIEGRTMCETPPNRKAHHQDVVAQSGCNVAGAQTGVAKTHTAFPPQTLDLQARLLRRRFALTPDLARIIAGIAFAVEARA
jgi:hypothetical protein